MILSSKELNKLMVKVGNAKGTERYEECFNDLYIAFYNKVIVPFMDSYTWQKSLKGEVVQAKDVMEDKFFEVLNKWIDEEKYITEPDGFYKYLYLACQTAVTNLYSKLKAKKRSHEYGDDLVRLDYTTNVKNKKTNKITDVATMIHSSMDSSDFTKKVDSDICSDSFEDLLVKFKNEHPKESEIIAVLIEFAYTENPTEKEKVRMLKEHFNVDDYSKIQKPVSRARLKFKNFLIENEYKPV